MRFLVDEQLPIRLARELSAKGHVAWHVRERLFASVSDRSIWLHAISDHAVIITRDADYLTFLQGAPPHTPVIWIRLGNCGNARLVDLFVERLGFIETSLNAGEMLVELR